MGVVAPRHTDRNPRRTPPCVSSMVFGRENRVHIIKGVLMHGVDPHLAWWGVGVLVVVSYMGCRASLVRLRCWPWGKGGSGVVCRGWVGRGGGTSVSSSPFPSSSFPPPSCGLLYHVWGWARDCPPPLPFTLFPPFPFSAPSPCPGCGARCWFGGGSSCRTWCGVLWGAWCGVGSRAGAPMSQASRWWGALSRLR